MFIKRAVLRNFLSFGPEQEEIKLKNLNIFIGPNGSGKSNFLDAVSLLRSAPGKLIEAVRRGGGVSDWLWKGGKNAAASMSFDFDGGSVLSNAGPDLNYTLDFTAVNSHFEITKETIGNTEPLPGYENRYLFYSYEHGAAFLNEYNGFRRSLRREDISPESSVLCQRKDSDRYPEITNLGKRLENVKIYREWHFGADCTVRQAQITDDESAYLKEDCSNLALVLSSLLAKPSVRRQLNAEVKNIYDGAEEVNVRIEGGRAVTQIIESGFDEAIPANRLSDGTLRYLCLMAILLNPNEVPLICLDEPELGMHPDLIGCLASMLKKASEHTQIIVNTHSPLLLDAFSDMPECVFVCGKENGCTHVENINDAMHGSMADSGSGKTAEILSVGEPLF